MPAAVRTSPARRRLRRRFAAPGVDGVRACGRLPGAAGVAPASAGRSTWRNFFFVEQDGSWICDRASIRCPVGRSSEQIVNEVLAGLGGEARPDLYLRVAKARNDCSPKACTTAVPDAAHHLPVLQKLRELRALDIKLGVVVGAERDNSDVPREAERLALQACAISKADTEHLYAFMFLDLTRHLSDKDLIKVVKAIKRGETADGDPCPGGAGARRGWPAIITNDNHTGTLDTGAWAHARHLGLLGKNAKGGPISNAAQGKASALTPGDRKFLRRVKRQAAGSLAVLRLEVTTETSRFAGLEQDAQCSLLTRWARAQQPRGYTFIYPLFAHGVENEPYDSIVEGTLGLQRQSSIAIRPTSLRTAPAAR